MKNIKSTLETFRDQQLAQQLYQFQRNQDIYNLHIKEFEEEKLDYLHNALLTLSLIDFKNQEKLHAFHERLKNLQEASEKHFLSIKSFVEDFRSLRDTIKTNNKTLEEILNTLKTQNITSIKLDLSENEKLIQDLNDAAAAFTENTPTTLGFNKIFEENQNFFDKDYKVADKFFELTLLLNDLQIVAKTLDFTFNLIMQNLEPTEILEDCLKSIRVIYLNYMHAFIDYAGKLQLIHIYNKIYSEMTKQKFLAQELCAIVVEN